MKSKILVIVILLILVFALIALTFKQQVGPHGGVVKKVEEYNIEVKTAFPFFYAYLLDNKLQPINNKGISCEARFIFPDDNEIKVPLKTFSEDGFICEIDQPEFLWCKVYFDVYGKPLSERFENETLIARNK